MEHIPGYYLLIFFIVFWIVFMFFISRISGWSRLALYYREVSPHEGRKIRFQSASMRWMMGYNNCLTFGTSREGLHISIALPMRIAHPNLMIPWVDISSSVRRARLFGGYQLHFAQCPDVNFVISRNLMGKISQAMGGEKPIRELP